MQLVGEIAWASASFASASTCIALASVRFVTFSASSSAIATTLSISLALVSRTRSRDEVSIFPFGSVNQTSPLKESAAAHTVIFAMTTTVGIRL